MTKTVMDASTGRMLSRKNRKARAERQTDLKNTLQGNARNLQYLDFKAQSDVHRVKEIVEEDVSGAVLSTTPSNKHVVFTETEEEFKNFDPLKYFDTTKEMLQVHPALRGSLSVMKNTVLPETVLLAGHHVKTTSQRRAERRKIQEELARKNVTDEEERDKLVEKMKQKLRKEDKVAFSELVQEQSGQPTEEEEEVFDPVEKLKAIHNAQETARLAAAARRAKEVTQRMERSKSLSSLASVIRRQNNGIRRQLDQRKENRFKPNATRRAR
ncbi:U3 small nucleolar RNA-associated protein 11 [Angomonas deanei]|nr:U3 small nucleolar RNA-associated protein 11 [Angomonas deanei]|eukprot:EPY40471.1 U3 small nucleolar RNA-associated protein 11 [Angomonas deanei]